MHLCHSLIFISSISLFPLAAQSTATLEKDVEKVEAALSSKGGTEEDEHFANAVKQAQKLSTSTLAKKNIRSRYQRSLDLQESNVKYLEKLASGEVRPFRHTVENWANYPKQVKEVGTLHSTYTSTEDTDERAKLALPLLTALGTD